MNPIDRSIWIPAVGRCLATAVQTACTGKAASGRHSRHNRDAKFLYWRHLSWSLVLAWGAVAQAEPTGAVVTAGGAVIGGSSGHMTVTQSTPSVAIQWQSFGIGAGQSVRFVQPGSASVALNRVVGGTPSAIMGQLTSNGQVFLVNPSGILFGAGAEVQVGGLVASTLHISDSNFVAGHYKFSGAGPGAVVNQGTLRATPGGYVTLLGANVSNQGTISAQQGWVALAAGDAVTLAVSGDQLLNVAVERGVANALLVNGGLLQADGGQVLMSTQVAGHLLSNAVNTTGVIQARTLENRDGKVVLLASMEAGTVQVGGQLDVSGAQGNAGGRVVVTGHQVELAGAQINASGDAGGGVVLIGGGYQGGDPLVPNAQVLNMSSDTRIQADAHVLGQGGQVVLWSDAATRALGTVTARGGAHGGDGGSVETSGHWLDVSGARVDTRAAQGRTGNWLLDPADITISSSATSDGTISGGVFSPNSGVHAANIDVADLVAALGGNHVTVTTQNTGVGGTGQGDIGVNAAITWTAPTTLTLNAARDLHVNQAITGTGGSVVAHAGRDIHLDAVVTTTTGNLSFNALQDVNLNAATTITTGDLTAVAGRHVNVSAPSTITTGHMSFRADNDGTGPGASAGTVTIGCGIHCLTVNTGQLSIRFNPVSYGSTNSEILTYADRLTGGGTLDAKAWVFGLGDHKIYDANTAASVSGLMPDLASVAPSVTLGAVSQAQFDTRHAGVDKPISFQTTFSDATHDLYAPEGAVAGTYQARADVLVRPLTVTAVTDSRAYNGTTSSAGTPTVTGLQQGDSLNGSLTQRYASKDALGTGNSTLLTTGDYTVSDGQGGNNYAVGVLTAPGTITPTPLTITASDVSKWYGQTPTLAGFSTSALVNGETVQSVTQTSEGQAATASVDGSPYAITPSGALGDGFMPANYAIQYVNGALTVNPSATVPPVVPPTEPTETPVDVTPEEPPLESAVDSSGDEPVDATAGTPDSASSPVDGDTSGAGRAQTVALVPELDAKPALLVIAPLQPLSRGRITGPAWAQAKVPAPSPLPSPAQAMEVNKAPTVVPIVKTVPFVPMAPVRPRKQDRN